MPDVIIDRIEGLDQKSSETDLDLKFATELKNFSTTKKPGALVKDGTYLDVSTSLTGADLPASLTRKSLFQIGLTSPADTSLYIVHAQDGSSFDRVYVGQDNSDADISQMPATGWRELTEKEGTYTTDSGSNANQIVDSELSSSTDDYYNGWIVVVTISGSKRAAIVTDYVGSTKTLSFVTGALNGNGAGNSYTLSRTPILANAGNSYIANVDDVIRWIQRDDGVIGLTGNSNQWPLQYQLWYGYVNRTFGTGASAEAFSDFWLDVTQLLQPSTDVFSLTETTGGNLTTAKTYRVYIAYIYDGFQIGPKSTFKAITLTSTNNRITMAFEIPYLNQYTSSYINTYQQNASPVATPPNIGTPANYAWQLLSRRVTGVRIYLVNATDAVGTEGFVAEKQIAGSNTSNIDFTMNASKYLTLSVNIDDEPSGNSHLQDIGQTPLPTNYKYAASISSHFIGAGIRTWTGDRKGNNLLASIVDGAGVATPDNFGASNIINLGFFGSKSITAVHVLGDQGKDASPKASFLVFTDDDYYIIDIVAGASFSHRLDNIGEQEGLFAPDSLAYAEGNLFGVSRNGFRVYTPQGTKIIGEGLKDAFDSLTDPSEGIGAYYKKERLIIFHFATDSKTYAVDLLSPNFNMFEFSLADTFVWLVPLRNGNLLAIDASKIYQFGSGSDQDGTKIVPQIKTKRIDARHFRGELGDEIILTEGVISYRSDTAITFNLYRNNSTTAHTFNNLSLPAKTTEGEQRFLFPLGTRAYEIEAEVTLDATQKTTNTILDLNSLRLKGYTKKRIS